MFIRYCVLVAMILLMPASMNALDLNDVSFHASFKDGLKADIAKGKAEPIEIIGKPEIVDGRNSGKAIKLRNGVDAVGFELKGNLNPEKGAFSFWLAPGSNWGSDAQGDLKGGDSQVLFHTGDIADAPQRMVLQTYWRSNLIGMLIHSNEELVGGWSDGIFQNVAEMPKKAASPVSGEAAVWTHYLFSWRDGRVETYVNGELKKRFERPDLSLRKLGDRFYLGWKKDPSTKEKTNDPMCMKKGLVSFDPGSIKAASALMDTPWETLISDLTLFDVYLNKSEAEKIFSDGAVNYAKQGASTASGNGLPKNSLLFYASFDKDVSPDIFQKQDSNMKPFSVGKPTLVEGKSGKALRIVSRKSGVTYPLDGNLKADKGTVAFWLSSENWDSKDDVLQILFTTDGVRRFEIQQTYNTRSLDLMWFQGRYINEKVDGFGKCPIPLITHETLVEGIERMMPKVWFHMAYSWGDGEMRAYRNGVCVGKTAYPQMEMRQTQELGKRFAIGAPDRFGGRYITEPADLTGKQYGEAFKAKWAPLLDKEFITLIDEFAMFDRNLNESQIAKLYKNGVSGFMTAEASSEAVAELKAKPLPTKGRIVFEAIHGTVPKNSKAVICIIKKDDTSMTRDIALTVNGDMSRGEMGTKGLPAGLYDIDFKVQDVSGKVLVRNEKGQTFELAPQEEWWNSKIGLDDIVLPPWTPMKKDGDGISCWGRTITFNGKAMPEQIVSKGANLLASPITLDVSLDGKKLDFANGSVNFPLVSETAMERAWSGEKDGLLMSVQSRTEFDGFIWNTVKIENKSGKPLTGLALNIPCRKEEAMFIHTPGRGWRGDCPPDLTTNKEWKSAYGGFSNPVWLGGYERGIQWLTEGRGGWFNKDKSDEIRVRSEGDRVILTVKMIDSPCDKKEFTVKFGLHPTPVKPPVARSKRLGPIGTYGVVPYLPRQEPDSKLTEQEFHQEWRKNKEKMGDPKFFRYNFINSVASYYAKGAPVRERTWYKSEWENIPGYERLDPLSWSWFQVCAETSYADWWVWQIRNRIISPDYENMAGIYFDHGSPINCCNTLHDGKCGYIDENGVSQPTMKIVAMRNLLKRIYCAVKGIDKEHPQGTTPDYPVVLHSSTDVLAAHLSFAYHFDGETWRVAGGKFMDRLTTDFMAAEWSHTPWGYDERGTCFKHAYFMDGFPRDQQNEFDKIFKDVRAKPNGQWKDNPAYKAAIEYMLPRERECNAMFLLFDRTPVAILDYFRYEGPSLAMKKAFEQFGFYQDDAEFMGFWKTGELVKGQTDKIKASAYVRKAAGKALIVVTNMNNETARQTLTLDTSGLGLKKAQVKLSNAETGEAINASVGKDGMLSATLPVPGRDYMLLLAE